MIYVSLCKEKVRELSCSPPAMPIKIITTGMISNLHLYPIADIDMGLPFEMIRDAWAADNLD